MQNGQCESDCPSALVILQVFRAVELFAHVLGDIFIETRLRLRELVRDRVGDAFRKQRSAVECEQVLLYHAPHQA